MVLIFIEHDPSKLEAIWKAKIFYWRALNYIYSIKWFHMGIA